MKRSLFFSGALALMFTLVGYQKLVGQPNLQPFWSTKANSNATATSKLGTTNAINLRLFTNNLERLHINSSNGYVGIGTTTPIYQLQVVSRSGTAIYGRSVTDGAYGVYAIGSYNNGIGVFSTAATAVYGSGTIGLRGRGGPYGAYGVYAKGNPIGVFGWGDSRSGINTVGVYGEGWYGVYGYGGYIGVYGSGDPFSYAGYFNGDVYNTASYLPSDLRLKQNITDMSNALDIINKLQPKYYEYKQDGNFKLMNLPQGKQYGLIAQDVEQVLPGLVKETEFNTRFTHKAQIHDSTDSLIGPVSIQGQSPSEKINFKALNYTELIPIMIKAMQEMDKKNDELSKENESFQLKLEEMQKELNELKAIIKGNNTIADLSSASLEQNTPNPFNSATIIRYHLPESAGSAKVIITDMSGKMIKSISLNSRGIGEVNLNSGTFAAGSYSYALWVDGKLIDSKKMTITK